MSSIIGSVVRPLAVALVLSVGLVPTAFAQGKDRGGHVKHDKDTAQFPMKTADFMAHVEKRIQKTLEHVNRKLAKHNVPAAVQKEILKDFEAAATQVRAAATKVGADGTVTKEEGKQVRELAKDLRAKARAKYGEHGKDKAGRRGDKDA